MRRTTFAVGIFLLAALPSSAGEPIVGDWKTTSGDLVSIAACGTEICITVKTGKYTGKKIGRMSGADGAYNGEVTDPAEDKTYSGSATVKGDALRLQGCVMKVLCKTQTWTRT